MAVQLGIAYSSLFASGFAAYSGGPYDCARNQDFSTICLGNVTPSIDIPVRNMKQWSEEGKIDDLRNLRDRRVFLQTGEKDDVVGTAVTGQLERQLREFIAGDKMRYVVTKGAAHAFPTDFDADGNSDCGVSESPYVANCGFDGAGQGLKWLYRAGLRPTEPEVSKIEVQEFAQTGAFGALGLATTGYMYIPEDCRRPGKKSCRLHVALHGCTMSYEQIGDKFIQNSGYLPWAKANNIIVLFPQATVDTTSRRIWNGTLFAGGALACFDWVGWVGEDADHKSGAQMRAIVNTVHSILRGSR